MLEKHSHSPNALERLRNTLTTPNGDHDVLVWRREMVSIVRPMGIASAASRSSTRLFSWTHGPDVAVASSRSHTRKGYKHLQEEDLHCPFHGGYRSQGIRAAEMRAAWPTCMPVLNSIAVECILLSWEGVVAPSQSRDPIVMTKAGILIGKEHLSSSTNAQLGCALVSNA